ncbi:hypothetical protein NPIL_671771 [Nephila pilipes]|uniref:Uncharacterized protein n=1 Tax=Nephila pilipes TaxID=299642 RepID=A0A8X6NSQ0_NEPPI|nr:hypothetical protein NPIL_671771 [Nephila pilipes]
MSSLGDSRMGLGDSRIQNGLQILVFTRYWNSCFATFSLSRGSRLGLQKTKGHLNYSIVVLFPVTATLSVSSPGIHAKCQLAVHSDEGNSSQLLAETAAINDH